MARSAVIGNEVADDCCLCTQCHSGKVSTNYLDMMARGSSFALGSNMEAISSPMIQQAFSHLAVSVEKCLHHQSYFLG